MIPEKTIVSQLENSYSRAFDTYKMRGLHVRVRDVSIIKNKDETIHEKLRHNSLNYELVDMNRNIKRILRKSIKKDYLIKIYEEIDLSRENLTSANVFEKRLDNLLKIIDIVKNDPEKFFPNQPAVTKNVTYSNNGVISQCEKNFTVKNDAKKLIDYLWGKRRQTFLDKTPDKRGRPVKRNSVIANCDIIDKKLTNVIDNFNSQLKKPGRKIDAHIKRENGLIQLEVTDEFSTSK